MRNIKYFALIVLVLLYACSSAKKSKKDADVEKVDKPQVRERIAVLDFKTVNLPGDKSRIISELIRTDLINTNKFTVIERSQVDMIFKEHGFSSTGVTDDSSAAKIGKLLTAKKILIGSVMKVGEGIVITSRVVDVEKGVAENSAKVTAESDDALVPEVSNLVAMLTGGESAESQFSSSGSKVLLKAAKKTYKVGEDIVVTYKNFPGTKYDYISIAKESDGARSHYSYQYTNRQREGTVTFYSGVNAAGKYEARSHTNYDKGDIQPTAVFKFIVK